MSRSVADFETAYKVITQSTNQSGRVGARVYGPYATLGAAKGRRTSELAIIEHFAARYAQDGVTHDVWIERTSGDWEKVDA